MLEFAASQACVGQKEDYVPLLWFADSEDLLVFFVIEHPHLRRVLVEHLDIKAWVRQVVIFGQPAAAAFQGGQMCVGRSVDIIFQDMLDIMFDVFGFEISDIDRGKFSEPFDDHAVMDLCAEFVTPVIAEPSDG